MSWSVSKITAVLTIIIQVLPSLWSILDDCDDDDAGSATTAEEDDPAIR